MGRPVSPDCHDMKKARRTGLSERWPADSVRLGDQHFVDTLTVHVHDLENPAGALEFVGRLGDATHAEQDEPREGMVDSALLAGEVVERRVGLAVDPVDRAAFAALLRKCASDGDMIEAMSRRGFDEDNAMALRPQQWVDELFRVYAALLEATGEPAR